MSTERYARIARAVDSLFGHLVPNNPRDSEDVINARRKHCFEITEDLSKGFAALWESVAYRNVLTIPQTPEYICHSRCQPRLRCYQT